VTPCVLMFCLWHIILEPSLAVVVAEEEMDAPSLNNSCIAMIVKEGGTTTASLSSDGSEQEPLHLDAAGQSPSAQVLHLWFPYVF
jgi:hypothetical protein